MNKEQRERFEQNRIDNQKNKERLALLQPPQKPGSRLRESYRKNAERLNPNPAVQVFDGHGRPKQPSDNHQWLGSGKP